VSRRHGPRCLRKATQWPKEAKPLRPHCRYTSSATQTGSRMHKSKIYIYESLAARYRTSAAGVFLARPDFLTRLQRSDAGLLKEGKTTQITLQEIRREEQPRPNEGPAPADTIASRSYRRATWRLSIGALLCFAVCGFIFGLPDFAAWTQSESGLLARPVPTDRACKPLHQSPELQHLQKHQSGNVSPR